MRKIFLLDGYNLFYRCFYAVPPFTGPEGQPVNAVFGLAKILLGFSQYEKPDYLAVVMDSREQNFRAKIYAEYKATRDRMPDDLRSQEALFYDLLEALGVPVFALGGYEADDIIGTFVTKMGQDPDNDVYIVSGDKDLYQFVGDRIAVYDTMKSITARRKEAVEKFGVPPERVVDYLAIVGDSSDNIPGIPGFGPKKAEALISEFGSLEDIYDHLGNVSEKMRQTLEASREVAFLSKKLATIDTAVPLDFDLESFRFHPNDFATDTAKAFFRKLNFKSLLPAEETVLKDFPSLGVTAEEVTDRAALDRILTAVKAVGKVTFATFGERDRFAGCVVGIGGKYFTLRSKTLPLREFLEPLLALDIEIVGFDCKADLRATFTYIADGQVSAEEAQGALF